MKNNLKIKILGIIIMIIVFSLIETFLWHNKFTIGTITNALFCILPFVFLVKFKNGSRSNS
jgi:uncharacterized membrane protein YqhA